MSEEINVIDIENTRFNDLSKSEQALAFELLDDESVNNPGFFPAFTYTLLDELNNRLLYESDLEAASNILSINLRKLLKYPCFIAVEDTFVSENANARANANINANAKDGGCDECGGKKMPKFGQGVGGIVYTPGDFPSIYASDELSSRPTGGKQKPLTQQEKARKEALKALRKVEDAPKKEIGKNTGNYTTIYMDIIVEVQSNTDGIIRRRLAAPGDPINVTKVVFDRTRLGWDLIDYYSVNTRDPQCKTFGDRSLLYLKGNYFAHIITNFVSTEIFTFFKSGLMTYIEYDYPTVKLTDEFIKGALKWINDVYKRLRDYIAAKYVDHKLQPIIDKLVTKRSFDLVSNEHIKPLGSPDKKLTLILKSIDNHYDFEAKSLYVFSHVFTNYMLSGKYRAIWELYSIGDKKNLETVVSKMKHEHKQKQIIAGIKVNKSLDESKIAKYVFVIENKYAGRTKGKKFTTSAEVLSLLDDTERERVLLEVTRLDTLWDAFQSNTCPHVALLARFNSASNLFQVERSYQELAAFFKQDDVRGVDFIKCNNCSFEIMCSHVADLTEAQIQKLPYRELRGIMNSYMISKDTREGFAGTEYELYCKVCSGKLGESKYRAVIDTMKQAPISDNISGAIYREAMFLMRYISFREVMNDRKFANLAVDFVYPYLLEIEKKIKKSRTASEIEINGKMKLFAAMLTSAYVLTRMELTSMTYLTHDREAPLVKRIIAAGKHIMTHNMNIINNLPEFTLEFIKNTIVNAYNKFNNTLFVEPPSAKAQYAKLLSVIRMDPAYAYICFMDGLSKREIIKQTIDNISNVLQIKLAEDNARNSEIYLYGNAIHPQITDANIKVYEELFWVTEDQIYRSDYSSSEISVVTESKVLTDTKASTDNEKTNDANEITNDANEITKKETEEAIKNAEQIGRLPKVSDYPSKPRIIPIKDLIDDSKRAEYMNAYVQKSFDMFHEFISGQLWREPYMAKFRLNPAMDAYIPHIAARNAENEVLNFDRIRNFRMYNKRYGSGAKVYIYKPAILGSLYSTKGIKHKWDSYVLSDGSKVKIADITKILLGGKKFTTKIVDRYASNTNTFLSKVNTNNKEIKAAIDLNNEIESFYYFYQFRCPIGGLHSNTGEDAKMNSKCSKCGLVRGEQPVDYYKKHLKTYKAELAKDDVKLAPLLAPFKQDPKAVSSANSWKYNDKPVYDLAKLLGVPILRLQLIGVEYTGLYSELMSGKVKPAEPERNTISRLKDILHTLHITYNKIRGYTKIAEPSADLKAIIEESRVTITKLSSMARFYEYAEALRSMERNRSIADTRNYLLETIAVAAFEVIKSAEKIGNKALGEGIVKSVLKAAIKFSELTANHGIIDFSVFWKSTGVSESDNDTFDVAGDKTERQQFDEFFDPLDEKGYFDSMTNQMWDFDGDNGNFDDTGE